MKRSTGWIGGRWCSGGRIALAVAIICSGVALSAAGGEITLRVIAPDAVMDSMRQDLAYETALGTGFRWRVRGSQRFVKNSGFNGLDEAYVAGGWTLPGGAASFTLLAGRATVNWSLWGGDSLILSDYAPGVDQVQYTYENGPVKVEKIAGRLSGDDRYLLGHRLTLRYGYFTGAVGETVVCSGKFAGNLVSLLPWPYYWTQWVGLHAGFVANDDVNAFAFVQGEYNSPGGLRLGAEVLVDDMPHWFGVTGQVFQAGGLLHAEIPAGAGRLHLQYARVNNFTYTFQVQSGNYTNSGYMLGFPQGPDVDEWRIRYTYPRGFLGLDEVGLVLRRHGEGRLGDVWEPGGVDAAKQKEFLAGVVESSQLIYAAGTYPLWRGARLDARFGIGPVQNAKNKAGYNKVAPDGAIGISWQF